MNISICPKQRALKDFNVGAVISPGHNDYYIKIRCNPKGITEIFRLKTFLGVQFMGYESSLCEEYHEVGAEILIKLDGSEKVINSYNELKEGDVFMHKFATDCCYLVISPTEVFTLGSNMIHPINNFAFTGQNLLKVNHELKIFSL